MTIELLAKEIARKTLKRSIHLKLKPWVDDILEALKTKEIQELLKGYQHDKV